MYKHKATKLFLIFFACIILSVLIIYFFTKSPIKTPDKIIIYNYGTKTELTKNNPKFNKIVKGMNKRLCGNSSMATLGIPEDWESDIKDNNELGVEFIYSKEQTYRLKDRVRAFSYTRLFFPINDDVGNHNYENLMFFSIKDENYNGYYNGPIGLSPCSKELNNILKDFK